MANAKILSYLIYDGDVVSVVFSRYSDLENVVKVVSANVSDDVFLKLETDEESEKKLESINLKGVIGIYTVETKGTIQLSSDYKVIVNFKNKFKVEIPFQGRNYFLKACNEFENILKEGKTRFIFYQGKDLPAYLDLTSVRYLRFVRPKRKNQDLDLSDLDKYEFELLKSLIDEEEV